MPMFSIVVPCYNAAADLPSVLAHLQAQTEQNWEVICVNDGSTDRTLSTVMQAAQADPRVRLVHQTRQGAEVACRAGLVAAHGEWVLFLTPDMVLLGDELAELRASIVAAPEAGAIQMAGGGLLGTCYRRSLMLTADGFQITHDGRLSQAFAAQIAALDAPVLRMPTLAPALPYAPRTSRQFAQAVPASLAA